jgi:hypothetical protein
LYFYLINTQSEQFGYLLRDCTPGDAKAAWSLLLSFFESKTRASIKQLAQQLLDMKQGSKTVPEFLGDLFQTKSRLDSALEARETDLSEVLTMMVAVQGLGSKYDVLKQNLFLDDNLTLESCRDKILESTERINMESTEPAAIALKSSTQRRNPRSSKEL